MIFLFKIGTSWSFENAHKNVKFLTLITLYLYLYFSLRTNQSNKSNQHGIT